MEESVIGRDAEKKILKEMLGSKEAELITILGGNSKEADHFIPGLHNHY
ncbi:hypothetical protein ACFSQD_07240 [Flavihumibacter stibioxidans]|nr:hypothetical protein [Flavihumibacter stibioxidans]